MRKVDLLSLSLSLIVLRGSFSRILILDKEKQEIMIQIKHLSMNVIVVPTAKVSERKIMFFSTSPQYYSFSAILYT